MTDPELLAQFLSGDARALENLIRRHTDFVYAVARRRVGPSHADDVTQAVFILLVKKARTLRGRQTLLGWLHRTACFCSASLQRLEHRRRSHEQESAAMKSPIQQSPSENPLDGLDAALQRLDASHRQVILLHYLSQHDIRQTAALLHLSEAAARKRAQRGLEKLRALLRDPQPAASALAGLLQAQAALRAPATLAHAGFTAAQAAAGGTVGSTLAGALAKETLRSMYLAKSMLAASAVAAILAVCLSAGMLIEKIALAAPVQSAATPQADIAAPVAPKPAESFQLKWQLTSEASAGGTRAPGLTDPIVSKNILYFGDDDGAVRALNAKDGAPLWLANHGARVYALATDDQRLYFTSDKGVAALECVDGKPAWNLAILHGASSGGCALWPQTDSLFVAGNDGLVYALDRRTGDKMWAHSFLEDAPPDAPGFDGAAARISPAPARPTGIATDGKYVYQSIFDQSRLIALDCTTGKQIWSFQARGWIMPSAAFNDQCVFIGSQDKRLCCLKKSDGTLLWDFTTRSRIESAPAVLGDNVYIASCDGNLYCLSIASGQLLWNFQTDPGPTGTTAIYCKPAILQNTLYIAAAEGQVYALTTSGELIWKIRPSPGSQLLSSPATDGAQIFLTSRPTPATGGRGRGRVAGAPPPEGESSIIALGK